MHWQANRTTGFRIFVCEDTNIEVIIALQMLDQSRPECKSARTRMGNLVSLQPLFLVKPQLIPTGVRCPSVPNFFFGNIKRRAFYLITSFIVHLNDFRLLIRG